MPRPRFHKLSSHKRRRILQAAAREFAAHGFDAASLNKILEEAAISKGAAYYYFDDKADLFVTAVTFYAEEVMADLALDVSQLDADSFWPTVISLYRKQYRYYEQQPWALGVVKAAARVSQEVAAVEPSLARLRQEIERDLHDLLRQGQAAGVIRSDLPQDLLARLFIAVDDTVDRWLLEQWQELDGEEVEQIAGRVLQGLARFLAPAEDEP